MSNTLIKKLLIIFVSLLILVYIGYQIYNLQGIKLQTETAVYSTLNDSIDTKGYVIRDETIISNTTDGVVTYLLDDGEKVSNGGTVAEIYQSANDVMTQKEIDVIDEELSALKQLNSSAAALTTNLNTVNKQIQQQIRTLLLDINDEQYQKVQKDRSEVLYLLNQHSITTGKTQNFNNKISELQNKRDSLKNSFQKRIGTISSPNPGYFVSKVDGFENRFRYEDVLSLLPENLTSAPQQPSEIDPHSVGKVISGPGWYIACLVPSDDVLRVKLGEDVRITLPFASASGLPCRVEAINQPDKQSDAVVVLRCDYMNEELSLIREETMKLDVNSYSGILISKRSLHEDVLTKTVEDEEGNISAVQERVQGVYTVYGKEIVFKQIIPLYANNNYIICKETPSKDELFNGETVKMYDEVVTEGTNLYNGKIIK